MAPQLLSGKWALVTGASRGIGRAIAEAYASEGAKLILVARSIEALNEVRDSTSKLGAQQVALLQGDMGVPADVERLAKEALEYCGQDLGVLVINAGVSCEKGQGPLDGDPDEWDQVFAINVLGPMRLTRRLSSALTGGTPGVLVNIASIAGTDAPGAECAYAASKFALRGWSKSCYSALRTHGVKVVTICPGYVDTDMMKLTGAGADFDLAIRPEDIGQAALMPLRLSANAVPEEISIRVVRPCRENS